MDCLFDVYARALPRVEAWAAERFPRPADEPEAAQRRSIKAKALDLLRGLLPAASLSHMGIFATAARPTSSCCAPATPPLPEGARLRRMILSRAERR